VAVDYDWFFAKLQHSKEKGLARFTSPTSPNRLVFVIEFDQLSTNQVQIVPMIRPVGLRTRMLLDGRAVLPYTACQRLAGNLF
jgi:hypothetical protein